MCVSNVEVNMRVGRYIVAHDIIRVNLPFPGVDTISLLNIFTTHHLYLYSQLKQFLLILLSLLFQIISQTKEANSTNKHTKKQPNMPEIQKVAIVGCGAIGASWAALFLAQGLTVSAFDINPAAQAFLNDMVDGALPVLASLGLLKNQDAKPSDIAFTTTMEDALRDADLVQENGPEKLGFKQDLFNQMAGLVGRDAILATSSSGLTCSSIQEGMAPEALPARVVVGHPFNPPHLIPLVEVVGGAQTAPETVATMLRFYESVGKKAIHVRKEVVGHVANRLQAALFREIMYLLQEDVVGLSDIDKATSFGPGLRWGVMGPGVLFHLGGGAGGVRHMAEHLLGPMMSWYARSDPVITDGLRGKLVEETEREVAGRAYKDLVRQRDEELVGLLNIRKEWDGYAAARAGKGKEE